jgi:Icc-related predicted phosphoesterase
MKLLHVGDLHFNPRHFDWVRAQAGRYDAICLPGDLLNLFADHPGDQARWVRAWLDHFTAGRARLFVASGNHDAFEEEDGISRGARWLQGARRPGVTVDGDVKIWPGLVFACRPWDGGSLALPPLDHPVILLAHAPPEGTATANGPDGDWGDSETRLEAAALPPGSLVLCGHVHRPKNFAARVGSALVLNPGSDPHAAEPHHVAIDTALRRATLHRGGQPLAAVRY